RQARARRSARADAPRARRSPPPRADPLRARSAAVDRIAHAGLLRPRARAHRRRRPDPARASPARAEPAPGAGDDGFARLLGQALPRPAQAADASLSEARVARGSDAADQRVITA